jgi:hypothetical protein
MICKTFAKKIACSFYKRFKSYSDKKVQYFSKWLPIVILVFLSDCFDLHFNADTWISMIFFMAELCSINKLAI